MTMMMIAPSSRCAMLLSCFAVLMLLQCCSASSLISGSPVLVRRLSDASSSSNIQQLSGSELLNDLRTDLPRVIFAVLLNKMDTSTFAAYARANAKSPALKPFVGARSFSLLVNERNLQSGVAQALESVVSPSIQLSLDSQSSCSKLGNAIGSSLESHQTLLIELRTTADVLSQDSCISELIDLVGKKTANQATIVLASESVPVSQRGKVQHIEQASFSGLLELQASTNGTSNYPGVQYISPAILFGLLLSFFLLLVLWFFLDCLSSMRTPLRFGSKLAPSKEF